MRLPAVFVLAFALSLAGCSQTQAADSRTAGALPAASAPEALPKLPTSYWTARKQLLKQGFAPVRSASGGFRVCVAEMEGAEVPYGQCKAEMTLPEIEDCSGTGRAYCSALWRSPGGRYLEIVTAGEPQPGVITTVQWSGRNR